MDLSAHQHVLLPVRRERLSPTPHAAVPSALQLALPTILVSLGLGLVVPYAVISLGVAAPMRVLFPLYAMAVGALLTQHHRTLYPGFVLALFAFTPFLRRVVDYHAGYALFNLLLLAPYTGLVPALPALVRRMLGQRGAPQWPFVMLSVCIVYASFVALLAGKLAAVGNEPMRWVMPMAMCAFVMDRPQDFAALRKALMTTLLVILPVLVVYGIAQYLDPAPWDVAWLQNIDLPSFGLPEPYEIRVFSMMNSPLSVGVFAVSGMILLAGEGPLSMLAALAVLPLLAVTLLREAWIIGGIGVVMLLLLAPIARRLTLLLGIGVSVMLVTGLISSHVLPPSITNPLVTRFSTLSDVRSGQDTSADERRQTYDSMLHRLGESPWGEGFGANGTIIAHLEGRELPPLDSSILEGTVVYGVVAGAAYFLAILALWIGAIRAGLGARGRMAAHVALLVALVATTPIGQNLVGEASIIAWISVGLLWTEAELRRRRDQAVQPRMRRPALGEARGLAAYPVKRTPL